MSILPYISSPGNIDKALYGIKSATVPERVSQDFVKTILKLTGGSGDQMTSYLRKIGLVNSDGTPNDIYRRFRNPSSSGFSIAECIKIAYAPLYLRNEYMHELGDFQLLALIVEETGQAHDSAPVKLTFSCIKHLKNFADFSNKEIHKEKEKQITSTENSFHEKGSSRSESLQKNYGLNLGYTLNLNLSATADPAVFDAIFKSLKEHLLQADDG